MTETGQYWLLDSYTLSDPSDRFVELTIINMHDEGRLTPNILGPVLQISIKLTQD